MVELVFTTLKDLQMVWKRLNSDFVYKCENGVAFEDRDKLQDQEFLKNFTQKQMLKFFIQFSAVEKRLPHGSTEVSKKEYLCSFIWIKGNSVKFCEFVSKFKQAILDNIKAASAGDSS